MKERKVFSPRQCDEVLRERSKKTRSYLSLACCWLKFVTMKILDWGGNFPAIRSRKLEKLCRETWIFRVRSKFLVWNVKLFSSLARFHHLSLAPSWAWLCEKSSWAERTFLFGLWVFIFPPSIHGFAMLYVRLLISFSFLPVWPHIFVAFLLSRGRLVRAFRCSFRFVTKLQLHSEGTFASRRDASQWTCEKVN